MSGRTREGRDSGGQRGRIRGRLGERGKSILGGEGDLHTILLYVLVSSVLTQYFNYTILGRLEKSSKRMNICESKIDRVR